MAPRDLAASDKEIYESKFDNFKFFFKMLLKLALSKAHVNIKYYQITTRSEIQST